MKIVHMCLASFFADGFSYQENMLPKFHKALGHEVEVIASTQSFDEKGRVCHLSKTGTYVNEYGIQVTRLPYKWNNSFGHKLKRYIGTYEAIEKAAPDVLFIHGFQFMDADVVARYLKGHPNVIAYADNHADAMNSATNWISLNVLHKIIWKHSGRILDRYVKKFYGVLPVRVNFLKDVYGLPEDKCELLVMGVDDEVAQKATSKESITDLRNSCGIDPDDFLVVTGGKINAYRPETLNLMEAVIKSENKRMKLLVFGVVSDELKPRFDELCADPRILFVGWKTPEETNQILGAADLAVFPGLHSVLWEQTVGLGVPCVFRKLNGVDHVDLGGNAVFAEDVSTESLGMILASIAGNADVYNKMKTVAQERGMKEFSYMEIAKKCIQ